MDGLGSYVVRLYRQEGDGLTGTVESVETGETAAFRSPEELWAVLQRHPSRRRSSSTDTWKGNGKSARRCAPPDSHRTSAPGVPPPQGRQHPGKHRVKRALGQLEQQGRIAKTGGGKYQLARS